MRPISVALGAMIAAACGGQVASSGLTDPGSDDTNEPRYDRDAGTPPMTYPPEPPVTPPPPPEPPPFDAMTCGDGGGRLSAHQFCGSTERQVPCELAADGGLDGGPPGTYVDLDQDICRTYCVDDASECTNAPQTSNCSRIRCNLRMPPAGGGVALYCYDACPGGRRPEGFHRLSMQASTSLGRAFAGLAQLETASILAFRRLSAEITRLGLGRALADRAERAKADEVRHARATWRLAAKFGARPSKLARIERARERSLFELALENAEEGCVREAYGAVVAAHQAAHATDPDIRAVMTGIAEDEASHAELAWALNDAIRPRLADHERAEVDAVMARAFVTLAHEIAHAEHDRTLETAAGLPARGAALAGLDALRVALAA